jgi:MFS family permease
VWHAAFVPGPLLSIFLVVLVDVFGLTLVIPLLAIYAERFSATPLTATLLVSTYAVCQLLSAPVIGQLSDRYGRKPLLVFSQLGTCIGFIVMAKTSTLWMLFVARAIDGATAGNLPLAQAFIADTTKPENRTRSFALIGIAFGLGFFVGPVVTAWLVKYGYTAPIWAAVGLSATSILCSLVLLPGGKPAAPSTDTGPAGRRPSVFAFSIYRDLFTRKGLRGLLGQYFAYVVSFTTFTSGFALFAERRFKLHGLPFGPREVGFLFAYAGFLGIVLQGGLIGRLVKRFGEHALAIAGFAALVVAYALLALVVQIPALVAVTTISSFGNGVVRPTLTGLVSRTARPDEQGTVLGVTSSLASLAAILAPPIGGWVLERGLLSGWPLVAGIAAIGGLLGALQRTAPTPSP